MKKKIEWGKTRTITETNDGKRTIHTRQFAAGREIREVIEIEETEVKHDRQDVLTEFLRMASIVFNDESSQVTIELKKGTVDKPYYITARYTTH